LPKRAQTVHNHTDIPAKWNLNSDLGDLLSTADRGVADGIRGQLLVRDHEPVAVLSSDEGVDEADLFDDSLGVLDDDVVAETDGLGERDQQSGDEVAERALRREADDDAEDGRRGEQAARDGANLRNHEQRREQPDEDDRRGDAASNDPVPRRRLRRELTSRDRAVDQARNSKRDQQDHADDDQAMPERHAPLFDGPAKPLAS